MDSYDINNSTFKINKHHNGNCLLIFLSLSLSFIATIIILPVFMFVGLYARLNKYNMSSKNLFFS